MSFLKKTYSTAKRWPIVILFGVLLVIGTGLTLAQSQNSGSSIGSRVKTLKVERGLTEKGKGCVECHAKHDPGQVSDWKISRHAYAGVSCIDCHVKPKDAKSAAQHCEGVKGTDLYVSVLVSPKTCARCHPQESEQFANSGHYRAYKQIEPKAKLQTLMSIHEGRGNEKLKHVPSAVGCYQCHGSRIKLDENKRPTPESWPTAGMGTVYPDGGVGNCTTCHTRHAFKPSEARRPDACGSCHLGPDHPDLEIFEASKHGHVYKTDQQNWKWDSAPDAWEPGDYRGPTCATCHMSGIGDLTTTHNVTRRLKWNLWAPESKMRNSKDVMSPVFGEHKQGRAEMMKVCDNCHSKQHTNNYFTIVDQAITLYNEEYFKPAKKMLDELKAANLLKKNPWADEFQKAYYFLWHHEGRRFRQGAAMGAPDFAQWHGVFEMQIKLNEMKAIHKQRMDSKKIEGH
jgi:hypothetical protein